MSDDPTQTDSAKPPRATASRLSAAFASMMQPGGSANANENSESFSSDTSDELSASPRGIIEAILFVGLEAEDPQGEWIPAKQLAACMRDVSVEEIHKHIADLNAKYEEDHAPYCIEEKQNAFRMVLSNEFKEVMTQLQGEPKPVRLSPAVLEVLSIVAYRQPIDQSEIDELRGERSSTAVKQLERRGIVVRIDTEESEDKSPTFKTSERFLDMVSLDSLDQLPRIAEHND